MRVLIAPDKFKGTLTARQAAEAIARGWRKARPADELTLLPISDGGDGFGAVMGELLQAKSQRVKTVDAAHQPIVASWWWQPRTRTAIIESANIIGLAMLPPGKFHPFQLDTFGLGAAIQAVQNQGAKRIILGIGGSATNDGGFGLARALGWKFFNRSGGELTQWTELTELHSIQPPAKPLRKGWITVAVDVNNPLLGARGATRIYGPQKGIRPQDIIPAERCLRRVAQVMKQQFGLDFAKSPGAGAAGGLGFGLATFAGARFVSGFELFAAQAKLSRRLAQAELLITGEGALDRSSLMGKGAGRLAALGCAKKLPVIGLAGVIRDIAAVGENFHAAWALAELTTSEKARRRAAFWLTELAFRTAQKLPGKIRKVDWQSLRSMVKLTT
ncbi:MAG: glycerate kinase [Verrucomicrobiota bacterium]